MIVLGIESAVCDGSIAVLDGVDVLATFAGVSRAESIISGRDEVVAPAKLSLTNIDIIAVTRWPGSFTGIRIGMATAVGLARSIGKRCTGVSLFDAIAGQNSENDLSVAISIGRNQYGIQNFRQDGYPLSEPISISGADLNDALNDRLSHRILVCGVEYDAFSESANVEIVDQPLAILIARQGMRTDRQGSMQPIYLGK